MDIATSILTWTVMIAILIFSIIAAVLFIKDGKSAKQNNTKRHTRYTVIFIIGIILFAVLALLAALGIMLVVLSGLVMIGM